MGNHPAKLPCRLLSLILYALIASLSAKAAEVRLYDIWANQYVSTLKPVVPGSDEYVGTFTPPSGWRHYLLEIDGVRFGFPSETGAGSYNDLPRTFTLNAGATGDFYIGDPSANLEFGILVEIIDNNTCTMTLTKPENLPGADPVRLTISINGTNLSLSDDINGKSGNIRVGGNFEVAAGSSLTVGPVMAGEISYGVSAQPEFSDSRLQQTQVAELVSGGHNIAITTPGIYSIAISLRDGIPSTCTITKAEGDTSPLRITVNGTAQVLSADVTGQSGEYAVGGTFEVAGGGRLTVGSVSVGNREFGFSSQPAFTSAREAQTQTVGLAEGAAPAVITLKGSYSVSVRVHDGVPAACTIRRSRYTPLLTINGTTVSADADGSYSKSIFFSAGTKPAIVFDGEKRFLGADIKAEDGDSHSIALVSTDAGHSVIANGSYKLTIDSEGTALTYICTSYRDPSEPDEGFSSTFPEDMLRWTGNGYTADNGANSIFYEENSPGWSMQCSPRYDMHTFLIGNGDLGLILSGNRFDDMKLCHKTFYEGAPPSAYPSTTTGTGYIDAPGQYEELGRLSIRDYNEQGNLNYLTRLDMSKGVVSAYSLRQKPIAAEYFVSNPDDVFVANLTSEQPRGYTISLGGKLKGTCSDGRHFRASASLTTVSNAVSIVWDTDGTATAAGSEVNITGATRLTVVLACATSYDQSQPDFRSPDDIEAKADNIADAALAKGFKALYADHVADHSALYSACSLDFDGMAANDMSVSDLVQGGRDGSLSEEQWRLLETIIFNYGRYTLIGSSRRNSVLPSLLEGIWGTDDQWNRDIHADVNVEMNYWPAESTGLGDCHMGFLNYIINMSQRPEWRKLAAARAPGCDDRAWTLGNANNIFGHQVEFNSQYSEANAWFCHHLWQHYVYAPDAAYLERIVPVMENACRFWEKRLIDNGRGRLILPECWSPENGGGGGTTAVHGRQLVTDLFANTIEARRILGGDNSYLPVMKNILERLDNGIHVSAGAIEEWEGTTPIADSHRHLSHLMCLFPLGQLTPFDADDTAFNASIRSLELRGDSDGGEAAGWVDAWRANCRARTLQPNTSNGYKGAYENLRTAVEEKHLMLNLNNTTLGQYQIEGNAGLTSAMAEMLMQSYRGTVSADGTAGCIDLLPALPQQWRSGSIKGLRAKGGYSIDLTWRDNALQAATVFAEAGHPLRVHYPGISRMYAYVNGRLCAPRSNAPGLSAESEDDLYFTGLNPGDKIVISPKKLSTGIDEPAVDEDCYAPVEYFNLQGLPVAHPEPGGLYIRRQGTRITKVRM